MRIKKRFLVLLFITILFLTGYIQITAQTYFRNPVIPGDFADPTVIRIGDTYYASGTSSEWAPHYPIYQSTDLVNWSYIGSAFSTKPEWTKASFWAPELYVLNEKIYLYYTARRASDGISYIGVAVTDDIRNGFEDRGCLVEFGSEAIDAFVFEDGGELYITWKAYGLDPRPIELLCSRLSSDGLRLVGEPFMLLRDDPNTGLEGQYIFKKGDYYYILYSIRGCCGPGSDYAVSVARSKVLQGPYEQYSGNPILQGDGNEVLSCGHGTVTETSEGGMFYLYHAYMKGSGFYNGRQAFLKELAINKDNWPVFVTGGQAAIREPMPFSNIKQRETLDFLDLFEEEKLRPEWGWNFVYATHRITLREGSLLLTGKACEGNKYGTTLCVQTQKPDYEIETEVKDQRGICQGLTLYGDQDNLIIWGKENGHVILKQVRKGEEQILYTQSAAGNVCLRIIVNEGCQASFAWSKDGEIWQPVKLTGQQLDVSSLMPWDRAFRTGLIHTGDEKIPADFSYFRLNYK